MSNTTKSSYYQGLKSLGYEFEHHYRKYTTEQLQAKYLELTGGEDLPSETASATEEILVAGEEAGPDYSQLLDDMRDFSEAEPAKAASIPQREEPALLDTAIAGSNALRELQVIEVDAQGREWLQREIRKPASPRPRGRRVLKYQDPGVVRKTVDDGQYTEEVELPGEGRVNSEVRVTLPSFQVGIFRHRKFPFNIITYAGNEGFDFFQVNEFFGGAEMVPNSVKRKYVEHVLCYDIRLTIQAIRNEHRQLQLTGTL